MKVVIVGGVAGGASAAARIRRLDEHAQIIMIERSGYVISLRQIFPTLLPVRSTAGSWFWPAPPMTEDCFRP